MTDTPAQVEARESGWYWVRQHEVAPYICSYWNGSRWFDGPERPILPAEIGPPIPDPVTLKQHERLEAVVKAAAREIASVCRGGGLTKADGVVTDDGFIGFADWAEKHMVAALDTAAAPETEKRTPETTPETPERAR